MAVKEESMVALFGAAKTEEFLWAMREGRTGKRASSTGEVQQVAQATRQGNARDPFLTARQKEGRHHRGVNPGISRTRGVSHVVCPPFFLIFFVVRFHCHPEPLKKNAITHGCGKPLNKNQ